MEFPAGQRWRRRRDGVHPLPQKTEELSFAPTRDPGAGPHGLLGQRDEAERVEVGRHVAEVTESVQGFDRNLCDSLAVPRRPLAD